jgi:ubiquinone/menaquinone biosynthesis C-methylase UbiE
MNIKEAYNSWACQYDTNENKTRDLEAVSLRQVLGNLDFKSCLEVGCGTGKNTEWLLTKADEILAIDFSEEMLNAAKSKGFNEAVRFLQCDINQPWNFTSTQFDLAVFSLVLEHIADLDWVFEQVARHIKSGGYLYVGELHPFKQYSGCKAKFETEEGVNTLTCFTHNISDFIRSAVTAGFRIELIDELFDGNDKNSIPRILAMLFVKI